MNIVHNVLNRHIREGRGERPALHYETDDGRTRTVSYRELSHMVDELAAGKEKGSKELKQFTDEFAGNLISNVMFEEGIELAAWQGLPD